LGFILSPPTNELQRYPQPQDRWPHMEAVRVLRPQPAIRSFNRTTSTASSRATPTVKSVHYIRSLSNGCIISSPRMIATASMHRFRQTGKYIHRPVARFSLPSLKASLIALVRLKDWTGRVDATSVGLLNICSTVVAIAGFAFALLLFGSLVSG
jgi:hypothetical protein